MQQYQQLVQEDLNIGTGQVWVSAPGGGDLLSTQIGLHSVGRGQGAHTSTWAPGSVAAGYSASTTVTVTDAAVGDFVLATHDKILTSDLKIVGTVSAADTVQVVIHNPTSAAITVASGTLSVLSCPAVTATSPSQPPTPFAYYALEEDGTAPQDAVGSLHLTSSIGSPTRAIGKHNYGLSLDGGYVWYRTGGFSNKAAHSISAWLSFSASESLPYNNMFGTTLGTPVVMIGRTGTAFGIYRSFSFSAGASGRSVDTFYHLVYTFDGASTHKLFVNGELDVTVTGAGALTTDFFLNCQPLSTTTHVIDEVAWFSAELTQDQVLYLYNNGSGSFWASGAWT